MISLKFNNEMPLTENWVFNLVIIHYWHSILQLDTVKCFDTICIVKSAIYIYIYINKGDLTIFLAIDAIYTKKKEMASIYTKWK